MNYQRNPNHIAQDETHVRELAIPTLQTGATEVI